MALQIRRERKLLKKHKRLHIQATTKVLTLGKDSLPDQIYIRNSPGGIPFPSPIFLFLSILNALSYHLLTFFTCPNKQIDKLASSFHCTVAEVLCLVLVHNSKTMHTLHKSKGGPQR